MPTKLSQDQVENLNSDLDSLDSKDISLERKISIEDSINDGVDASLAAALAGKQNTANPRTLASVNGSNLTGNTNQISTSILVPANTLVANNTIHINALINKTVGSTTSTPRIYINTTNSLTGATLLATLGGMTGANYYQRILRSFYFDGTNLYVVSPTINNYTDFTAGTTTLVPLTTTTNYYLIFAIQNSSTTPDNLGFKRTIVQIYD